ncbi:MAG TPA: biotin/lipoyl-containing protein [Candidatus Limnocylindria bacterium]|nr:biotin/lipoyl-containing protein [Candidatus Limnocylindria bacterium]
MSPRTVWRDGERERTVELSPLGGDRYRVEVDGVARELGVERLADGTLRLTGDHGSVTAEVTAAGERRFVRLGRLDFVLERAASGRRRSGGPGGGGLESPMPGIVTRVLVAAGEAVKKGQPLLAIEAMKMEHLIRAPHEGRVRRIAAAAGEMVDGGVPLVELDADG